MYLTVEPGVLSTARDNIALIKSLRVDYKDRKAAEMLEQLKGAVETFNKRVRELRDQIDPGNTL